jgi:protein-L-isoaspartate(D-aspartate) O-methyltransferase
MRFWSAIRSRFAAWRQKPKCMSGSPWEGRWPEITDERVRAAFQRVDRSNFLLEEWRPWSDRDAPLPIGQGQTISQPFVVALMTQALALQPGDRVLEIGTGSGYQTAILAELTAVDIHTGLDAGSDIAEASKGAGIYSVERHADLSQRAGETLALLGYDVHLRVGDGAAGWPDAAPFDAVMLTAAPFGLPRPLWEQVADGGRLVAPIGEAGQEQTLWLLKKQGKRMAAITLGAVRFVPLVSPLLDDPSMRMSIEGRG